MPEFTLKSPLSRRRTAATLFVGLLAATGLHATEEIHKTGGDVEPPKLVYKVEPEYSEAARDAKVEGQVILHVVISSDGHVTKAEVVESLHPDLDHNAVEAVLQWTFAPATKKGKTVAVAATVQVNFRLN